MTMTEMEIWKAAPGCPGYDVSNLGRIRSNRGVLRPNYSQEYPYVTIHGGGKRRTVRIHTLICEAFHGPRPTPAHEVAHEDGIPANVSSDNLRWSTRSANMADKNKHGTAQIGDRNGNVILNDDLIRQIRATYQFRKFGLVRTARKFGIGKRTVHQIINGETWRHVS